MIFFNLFYSWLEDVKETKRKTLVQDILKDSTTRSFISSQNLPNFAEKIRLQYSILFSSLQSTINLPHESDFKFLSISLNSSTAIVV